MRRKRRKKDLGADYREGEKKEDRIESVWKIRDRVQVEKRKDKKERKSAANHRKKRKKKEKREGETPPP